MNLLFSKNVCELQPLATSGVGTWMWNLNISGTKRCLDDNFWFSSRKVDRINKQMRHSVETQTNSKAIHTRHREPSSTNLQSIIQLYNVWRLDVYKKYDVNVSTSPQIVQYLWRIEMVKSGNEVII